MAKWWTHRAAEEGRRPLPAAARRLRLHERVPDRAACRATPACSDLRRHQRDHEGDRRPRPRPLGLAASRVWRRRCARRSRAGSGGGGRSSAGRSRGPARRSGPVDQRHPGLVEEAVAPGRPPSPSARQSSQARYVPSGGRVAHLRQVLGQQARPAAGGCRPGRRAPRPATGRRRAYAAMLATTPEGATRRARPGTDLVASAARSASLARISCAHFSPGRFQAFDAEVAVNVCAGGDRRQRRVRDVPVARVDQRRVDLVGEHPAAVPVDHLGDRRQLLGGEAPGRPGCAGCRGSAGRRRRANAASSASRS